jgi:predicted AlkP superfamily pyrophosphatase or phosphodiesterase
MGVSPRNLLANTISDQLRLGSNFQAKVISVSFKDRGAALPGGHTANAAYWHDWQTSPGYFVTSSFYMDKLPDWVVDFNQSGLADEYLDEPWNTLYPIDTYTESAADNNLYERTLRGKDSPTFPYNFKKLRKVYRELNAEYQLLWVTPKGNTLLTDFAKQAIVNESLGADSQTDLLAISYSVPDAAGHAFGPQSVEMQDIYLRLDQDIASLLEYLDQNVGVGAYTVFLTADHGVAPVASYLQDHKLPTGIISIQYKDSLETHLADKYGVPALIQHFDRENIFLDRNLINQNGLKLPDVQEATAQFLSELYTVGLRQLVQNGFYQKRSGDVIVTFDPGLVMNADPDITVADIKGTGHGTGYAYDTHVPLLWYGWGIQPGSSVRRVSITDIAPTLAMMLNLQLPNGTSGQPLLEIFK